LCRFQGSTIHADPRAAPWSLGAHIGRDLTIWSQCEPDQIVARIMLS
jgi:hypothetical protein